MSMLNVAAASASSRRPPVTAPASLGAAARRTFDSARAARRTSPARLGDARFELGGAGVVLFQLLEPLTRRRRVLDDVGERRARTCASAPPTTRAALCTVCRRSGSTTMDSSAARTSCAASCISACNKRMRWVSSSKGARPSRAATATPTASSPAPSSASVRAARAPRGGPRRRQAAPSPAAAARLRRRRRCRPRRSRPPGSATDRPRAPRAFVTAERGELLAEAALGEPCRPQRSERVLGLDAGEPVEQRSLLRGREQRLVRVLAVEVDEPRVRTRRARRRSPDARSRSPATGLRRGSTRASTSSSRPSSKRPSTRASVAPSRTICGSARPPHRRSSASTIKVLPAPVSPVMTVRPEPRTTRSSAMMPRFSTRSSESTRLPVRE